jgi:Bax protein
MGKQRNFENFALALTAVAVAALYGAALLAPDEVRRGNPAAWVPLPPKPSAAAIVPVTPLPAKLEGVAIDRRDIPHAITVAELRDKLGAADFDLRAIRRSERPVPRLFVEMMPRGFGKLGDVSELKHTFFGMVLPLVLKVNEEILAERNRLLQLRDTKAAGDALTRRQEEWLAGLAARYDASPDDLATLVRRVDVIPPALALAQSAEESGWGRSRFAQRGNALFGQRTWQAGLGIVPHERAEDGRFEVRAFTTLLDSVRGYARNLNSHPAYSEFRARRAEMRRGGESLNPYILAATLTSYSERREDYVETIRKILRVNRLEEFNRSRLGRPPVKTTQVSSRENES